MAKQITTVLIDLSGTLHIDNTVIPGAAQALKRCFFFFYFLALDCNFVCNFFITNLIPTQSL